MIYISNKKQCFVITFVIWLDKYKLYTFHILLHSKSFYTQSRHTSWYFHFTYIHTSYISFPDNSWSWATSIFFFFFWLYNILHHSNHKASFLSPRNSYQFEVISFLYLLCTFKWTLNCAFFSGCCFISGLQILSNVS